MNALRTLLDDVRDYFLDNQGLSRREHNDQIVLLAQPHCLPSMVELFQQLIRADVGISPAKVVIVPKAYSSIQSALDQLSSLSFRLIQDVRPFLPGRYDDAAHRSLTRACVAALRICRAQKFPGRKVRLVVIDDGGLLTEELWRLLEHPERLALWGINGLARERLEIVSIQVTASGIHRDPTPQQLIKIDISRSAAKRLFEAKIIAKGVLRKVRSLDLPANANSVGVAGGGALGTALARDLLKRGKTVHLYDLKKISYPLGAIPCKSRKDLLRSSQIIFGCTGRNFLPFDQVVRAKPPAPIHFISCSSRDVEFKSLLEKGAAGAPYSRVDVSLPDGQKHFVENGGFPVNFDRQTEQESPHEIALTRALVLAGIFQAINLQNTRAEGEALMLLPRVQQFIVGKWMEYCYQKAVPEQFGVSKADFESPDWWRKNSKGMEDTPASDPFTGWTGNDKYSSFRALLAR